MATEWRQFRLLSRDALRKLLNAAVLGRDVDPAQFSIWATAVVMTPPSLYGFGQMFNYSALRAAPADVIERAVLSDRMFFVFYSMVAAGLLAALTWESLFPDRTDQEVVGTLPVRPRTFAAARLAAAFVMAAVFAAAINVPSALFFSFVAVTHPLLGSLPAVFIGHLLATMTGCLTVFLLLLIVRGAVAFVAGAELSERLATVVQFSAIVTLLDVFFYAPSAIPELVRRMLSGDDAFWLPPVWFTALYSAIVGTPHSIVHAEAAAGLAMLLAGVLLVVPIYLISARIMARRTLEAQAKWREGLLSTALRMTARLEPRAVCPAVTEFAMTSLGRNRRHLLVVVSYAAVGTAIATIGVIAAQARPGIVAPHPTAAFLAVPLVMMFFVVLGLRAAFRIPTDLDANWIFRLTRPSTVRAASGTELALLLLAVIPITALTAATAWLFGWPWIEIVTVSAFDLMMGTALVQCALVGWNIVPFACAHRPDEAAIRSRWLVHLIPLTMFAVGGAALEEYSLRSDGAALLFLACVVTAALIIRRARLRRARRDPLLFDAPVDDRLEVLNLSEALS